MIRAKSGGTMRKLSYQTAVHIVCVLAAVFLDISLSERVLASKTRIFWVDSYHSGYEWSDGIESGIIGVLSDREVEFGLFHMNTKACKDQACLENSARKAKVAVELFNPDVLIASDDNAQKYLVVPEFKDSELPVVFCGVNWDAAPYGYPARNITGMVEVDLVEETVRHMKRYAKGNRIGYISGQTTSDQKIISWLNEHFFDNRMISRQVETFDQFIGEFLRLQEETDMIFIRNYAGINGWNPVKARKFLLSNLRVPTGSNNDFMAPYVVFTLGKIPEEQGRWAAETALAIAAGKSPTSIPIVRNQQARLTVNLAMAGAADIVLPISILKVGNVVGQDEFKPDTQPDFLLKGEIANRRILWVDSYHKGYEWSDGVEEGIREVLFGSGVILKTIRMDTKRKHGEVQMKTAALLVKEKLEAYEPDLVIVSDDNAQQFLVVPYLKNSNIPVVFCGVNWDASMYGYPTENITGMVEVDQIEEMIKLLKLFARGSRIGYLSGDVTTDRKLARIYNEKFFNGKMKQYLVKSQAELEDAYLRAQQEVDILLFSNYAGIGDFDAAVTSRMVKEHTKIPTGSPTPWMDKWVLCTSAKSPQEQGRYAAETALKILSGTNPSSLPVATNRQSQLTINLRIATKLGVVFPVTILKKARIIK